MSQSSPIFPSTRSWRDIPQAVNARAIPRWGRWRRFVSGLGVAAMAVAGAGIAAGGWMVATELEGGSIGATRTATMPIKTLELNTDGTLDHEWLVRTLALAKGTTLEELDLKKLRARLMAEPQVLSANLAKPPGRLTVQISERTPMARILVEWRGSKQTWLVARDGVAFEGAGCDPQMVKELPWLAGFTLVPEGRAFQPIAGMEVVSDLLGRVHLEAEHLYRTWRVVSLERLALDREIEVRTSAPQEARIVFGAGGDFFRQIAQLNLIWEKFARVPVFRASIDLSLGTGQVPTTFTPLGPVEPPVRGTTPPRKNFPAFGSLQIKSLREF